jgi:hypothetical protein
MPKRKGESVAWDQEGPEEKFILGLMESGAIDIQATTPTTLKAQPGWFQVDKGFDYNTIKNQIYRLRRAETLGLEADSREYPCPFLSAIFTSTMLNTFLSIYRHWPGWLLHSSGWWGGRLECCYCREGCIC